MTVLSSTPSPLPTLNLKEGKSRETVLLVSYKDSADSSVLSVIFFCDPDAAGKKNEFSISPWQI